MKNLKWLIILFLLNFSVTTAEELKKEEAPQKNESSEKAAAPDKEKSLEKKENSSEKNYFSAGLKLDMTVPTAQIDTTWGFHGELRYILPWLNPMLSFGVEAGYYKLSGSGKKVDNEYGVYSFDWEIKAIPIYIGPGIEIKSTIPGLYFTGGAGFAMVFADAKGNGISGKNSAEDTAYGYYFGGGAELRFGIFGGITGEFRHTALYVDFGNSNYGSSLGNIGGDMFLLGYKYTY